jgi:hypothetical protein
MDIKKYKTEIKLYITPVWHDEPPICSIKFSKDVYFKEEIKENKIYSYEEYLTNGNHDIIIEFLNKKNTDTVDGKDKAIKIDKIVFNNIESKKFVWQGTYQPIYPEPWATQQKNLGKELDSVITPAIYLGWNGVWKLTYSAPIFTWIHKLENHGWIYD